MRLRSSLDFSPRRFPPFRPVPVRSADLIHPHCSLSSPTATSSTPSPFLPPSPAPRSRSVVSFSPSPSLPPSTVRSSLLLSLYPPPEIDVELLSPGLTLLAVAFLSLATHFSFYPILLLPALLLLIHQHKTTPSSIDSAAPFDPPVDSTEASEKPTSEGNTLWRTAMEGTAVFVAHQAALIGFSRWFTEGWDWVDGAYGVM